MRIYRRRFGRKSASERKIFGGYDTYEVEKNDSGWYISHISIGGQCNKRGEPYLFDNLNQDFINYPASLGDYMEYLWENSKNKDKKWLQRKINVLAKWISGVEKKTPTSPFWNGLK